MLAISIAIAAVMSIFVWGDYVQPILAAMKPAIDAFADELYVMSVNLSQGM